MSRHAYIDESWRRGEYLICAATIAPSDPNAARKALRGLLVKRGGRLHFNNEPDSRRRMILGELAKLDTETVIYVARWGDDQEGARAALLGRTVADLVGRRVSRLVLESREGQDARDRRVISEALRRQSIGSRSFTYDHHAPTSEPLLWVPDAVAWSWGRGKDWRRRVNELQLVADVVEI